MAQKLSPSKLEHLAANALVNLLNSTVKEMDKFISESSRPKDETEKSTESPRKSSTANDAAPASARNKTPYPAPGNSGVLNSATTVPLALDYRASAKAAMKVLDIRRYLAGVVSKELAPILLTHSISRAVTDQNVSLLRLTITSDAEVLDFRALEYWLNRSSVPANSIKRPAKPGKEKENIVHSTVCSWTPPDEFDWFSWDRMGKIITMAEACELFSIMKMSQCTLTLRELMMNATRPEYWTCSQEEMPVIAEAILQMKLLTKLILRGMADDYILKLIGQTATGLKYLDVSCSKFVTDRGVHSLFFGDMKDNSALCLIPSWIQKNLSKMSPIVHTIAYLDISWTNITSLSRKMVNVMPGSYMFKRLFAISENEAYGHHIFVRKTSELSMTIRLKDVENKFEAELHPFAGKNGTNNFLKFVEGHAWRNCNMAIYEKPPETPNGNPGEEDPSHFIGVITPSKEEKRIHGLITFGSNNLIELYSIFPINLNQLGLSCPKVQILRGVVTDHWHQKGYLLPGLTIVDVFCEPASILSIFSSCPNLKKVRVRILRKILSDVPLLQALASSMSTRTLEELWIAPGSFKKNTPGFPSSPEKNPELSSSSALSQLNNVGSITHDSINLPSTSGYQNIPSGEKYGPNSGTKNFNAGVEEGTPEKDTRIEDLVQLSVSCARKIISECKKIRRIGNLSWWWITEEQLENLCKELVASNSDINLLWDNLVLPGGCTLQDGNVISG